MGITDWFKRKKETLVIMIDLQKKRKYNLDWQRQNIYFQLKPVLDYYFENWAIKYCTDSNKKSFFTGIDIFFENPRFKLVKINNPLDPRELQQRYNAFLKEFYPAFEYLMKKLNLPFNYVHIQKLDNTLTEAMVTEANNLVKRGTINIIEAESKDGRTYKAQIITKK